MGNKLSVITTADSHLAHNRALAERLQAFAIGHHRAVELIIVDDLKTLSGFTLPASPELSALSVIVVQPVRRLGQLQAILHGIKLATGSVIVTIDPDMHENVTDIERMLDLLDGGKDVIYAWRTDRKDTPLLRRYLSRIYNYCLRHLFDITLHDINTPMTLLSHKAVKTLLSAHKDVGLHQLYLSHQFSRSFTEMSISVNGTQSRRSSYGYLALIQLAFCQLKSILKTRRILRSSLSHHA